MSLFGFGQERLLLLQCAQQQTFASRRLKVNTNPVNINTVVDEAKFTPFHWSVLIWCLLIIIFDGYEFLVIYGVALPLLDARVGTSVQYKQVYLRVQPCLA